MPSRATTSLRVAAWVAAALLTCVAPTARGAGEPDPVVAAGTHFFDGTLTEAAVSAAAQQRVLLVVAGADWCLPCHTMRTRVWPRSDVGAWVAENAVAYELDVDVEPRRATQLRVGPIPEMLLLSDGRELGRHVGLLDAPELLAWLERTASLPVTDEARRYDLSVLPPAPRGRGVAARQKAAQQLLASGQLDEAFEALLWLWEEGHLYDPTYAPMRRSALATMIGDLVTRHPEAREAFGTILARTEERLHGEAPGDDDFEDFRALALTVFDDPERLLELYADMAAEDGSASTLPPSFQRVIFEQLYEQGSLAAAARATPDLLERAEARLQRMNGDLQRYASFGAGDMGDYTRRGAAEHVARLHAAALAADREGVARAIGDLAREYLDDELVLTALVEEALATGTARAMHHEWIADSGEWWVALDDLRARLGEAYTPPPELALTASAPPPLDPSVREVVHAIETLFERDGGPFALIVRKRRFATWGDDAVPALRIVLDDSFAGDNRFSVFEALRECGTESCLDLMLDVMAGRTRMARDSFDWQLDRLVADPDVRAILDTRPEFRVLMERLAGTRSAYDKQHFAKVAARMGWVDAVPTLEAMLGDADADLRAEAAAALETLTGEAVAFEEAQRALPAERLLPGLLGEPIQATFTRAEPARFTSTEPIAMLQPHGASFWRGVRGEPAYAVHVGAGVRALDADGALGELVRLPSYPVRVRGLGDGADGAPTTLALTGTIPRMLTDTVVALDADGAVSWSWRHPGGDIDDAVPLYLDDGLAGIVVAGDAELFAFDLYGDLLWHRSEFTPAYELATHPRFPGLVVSVFGDLKVFDAETSRVVNRAERVPTSGYVSEIELFADADGEPALLTTGSGDGMARIARSDLGGEVLWEGDVPGRVRGLAQLDVGASTPLFAVATDALELLILDADGTLLHVAALPDPQLGGNSGPLDLSAGRLPDGRPAVHVQMFSAGFLFPLDVRVLDAR